MTKTFDRKRDMFTKLRRRWTQTIDSAIVTISVLSLNLEFENIARNNRYLNGGWTPCNEHMPLEKPSIPYKEEEHD